MVWGVSVGFNNLNEYHHDCFHLHLHIEDTDHLSTQVKIEASSIELNIHTLFHLILKHTTCFFCWLFHLLNNHKDIACLILSVALSIAVSNASCLIHS